MSYQPEQRKAYIAEEKSAVNLEEKCAVNLKGGTTRTKKLKIMIDAEIKKISYISLVCFVKVHHHITYNMGPFSQHPSCNVIF